MDDVVIAEKISPARMEDRGLVDEVHFQLADGDAVRSCTFLAQGTGRITRAALTVDGQLLHDDGQQSASLA